MAYPMGHKCLHARSGCRAGLEQYMFLCVTGAPWEGGGTGPGPPHFTTPTATKAGEHVPRPHPPTQLVEWRCGRALPSDSGRRQRSCALMADGRPRTASPLWPFERTILWRDARARVLPSPTRQAARRPCCLRRKKDQEIEGHTCITPGIALAEQPTTNTANTKPKEKE